MSRDASAKPVDNRRADPETFRARTLGVSMTVKDLQKSLMWYRDVVGFVVDRKNGARRKGAGRRSQSRRCPDPAQSRRRRQRVGPNQGAGHIPDVHDYPDRRRYCPAHQEMGGTLETEPADMPWGARVFRVHDPDGFLLVIASEGSS